MHATRLARRQIRHTLLSTNETQLDQRTRTKHKLNTAARTIHMAAPSVLVKSLPVQRPTQIGNLQGIEDVHEQRYPASSFTGGIRKSCYEHPAARWLARRRISCAALWYNSPRNRRPLLLRTVLQVYCFSNSLEKYIISGLVGQSKRPTPLQIKEEHDQRTTSSRSFSHANVLNTRPMQKKIRHCSHTC